MTDDELIERFSKFLFWEGIEGFKASEAGRLIVLARIGAAVKPRPISEALNKWVDWPEYVYTLNGATLLVSHKWGDDPFCFYDLSALSPPEQQEPK